MTRKRIMSYVLAVIMLVSTCAVPVSAATAVDNTTTTNEISQAEEHQETWELSGKNTKTTLFIGDSYFSEKFWPGFYEMYSGKDVIRAGISGTTTYDWEYFLTEDIFLAGTMPKNIVVHLGHNNIHYSYTDSTGASAIGGDDADTATANLKSLLTNIHNEDNLKNTKIYFFGITYKKSTMYDGTPYPESYKTTVDTVNANMKEWCAETAQSWVTYIEPVQTVKYEDSMYSDNTHLTADDYQIMVDLLAATDIEIERVSESSGTHIYYAQADVLTGEWNKYGNPGKTTLFIGDSFFDKKYWDNFGDMFGEQDVMLAGISNTSASDWQELHSRYLANTKPKNLVVHLGTVDIHTDNATGVQTAGYLQTLFEAIHAEENLIDVHIYYFGIPECIDKGRTTDVSASNTAMKTWCAEETQVDWITYIEPIDIDDSQFLDTINITEDGYQLIAEKLKDIVGVKPSVAIDFDKGTVENTGADSNSKVGIYNSTFVDYNEETEGTVEYTNGRNGDAGCAFVSNHLNGPYPVVKQYDFGKEDFIVSVWFNIEDITTLSGGSGTYLFGTDDPDTKSGFSACMQKNNAGYQLRLKNLDDMQKHTMTDFSDNTWYHLTLCREGTAVKWYLDGDEIVTHKIDADQTYDKFDIVFGAYTYDGTSTAFIYKDANVYFDDIAVYDNSLNDAQVAAICEDRNIEDERDVTCVVGDANYDDAFNTADLIRLQRYLVTEEVDECSLDGDVDVSGKPNSSDIERCKEMLVDDNALQVTASADDSYKRLQSTENYFTYYELHKGMKAGQTMTFDIIFGDGDYSAYAYYDGCGRWEPLKDTNTTAANIQCSIVAAEDINSLRIKVVNNEDNSVVKDYTVYNIKVSGEETNANRVKLSMTYDDDTKVPVLYDMSETLDMTKFAVEAETSDAEYVPSYTWTLMKDGVEKTVDMSSTSHVFDEPGMYLLTATETSSKNGYRTSMNIYVYGPDVYVNYNGGTVTNIGLNKDATVGTYVFENKTIADSWVKKTVTDADFTNGRNGETKGAFITEHYSGPYTVVEDYELGTNDFLISTNFMIPSGQTNEINDAGGTFIFGNDHVNTTDGFAVSIIYLDTGYYLRIKVEGGIDKTAKLEGFSYGTWHQLAVHRVGSTLYWYYDGEVVHETTLSSTSKSFGNEWIAFGAYRNDDQTKTVTYRNHNTYYDNISIYGSGLTDAQVQKICGVYKRSTPSVAINYANGTVTNTGSDSKASVGTYKFEDISTPTEFVSADSVTYVTGVSGDTRGAIRTNHKSGAYTVVDNYALGTEDFTVSTWINLPNGLSSLSGAGNSYLFGTTWTVGNSAVEGTDGFSVAIKNTGKIRVALFGTVKETEEIQCAQDTWHNIVVTRAGAEFLVYFDGVKVGSYEINETADFASKALAFGAYARTDTAYYGNNIYYDEIEVYGSALTTTQIQEICNRHTDEPDIFVNYASSTVANGGIYRDILLGRYMFNNMSKSDYLIPATTTLIHKSGVGGDDYGAAQINHHDGPYTSAHDYRFSTDNFTVSTWFQIPSDQLYDSDGNVNMTVSGTYLFGDNHPDSTDGFAVSIKYDDYTYTDDTVGKAFYLRLRLLGSTFFYVLNEDATGHPTFAADTWYHLTLCREGSKVKLYLDGELIHTDTMAESIDMGIEDITVGAYAGWGSPYKGIITYFDEVQIYHGAMTAGHIKVMTEKYKTSN